MEASHVHGRIPPPWSNGVLGVEFEVADRSCKMRSTWGSLKKMMDFKSVLEARPADTENPEMKLCLMLSEGTPQVYYHSRYHGSWWQEDDDDENACLGMIYRRMGFVCITDVDENGYRADARDGWVWCWWYDPVHGLACVTEAPKCWGLAKNRFWIVLLSVWNFINLTNLAHAV
jgi:hypothetical protein